ncbi:basic proline-rich protein-like [Myotis daubentonii]|uniref:basic proline-rich protein-like n=1 Tax=Myotis daubentonii TaxID=98922 RepID=UPI00287397D6|nr:basic proline-rich protein-like [Myotis daubentonii]
MGAEALPDALLGELHPPPAGRDRSSPGNVPVMGKEALSSPAQHKTRISRGKGPARTSSKASPDTILLDTPTREGRVGPGGADSTLRSARRSGVSLPWTRPPQAPARPGCEWRQEPRTPPGCAVTTALRPGEQPAAKSTPRVRRRPGGGRNPLRSQRHLLQTGPPQSSFCTAGPGAGHESTPPGSGRDPPRRPDLASPSPVGLPVPEETSPSGLRAGARPGGASKRLLHKETRGRDQGARPARLGPLSRRSRPAEAAPAPPQPEACRAGGPGTSPQRARPPPRPPRSPAAPIPGRPDPRPPRPPAAPTPGFHDPRPTPGHPRPATPARPRPHDPDPAAGPPSGRASPPPRLRALRPPPADNAPPPRPPTWRRPAPAAGAREAAAATQPGPPTHLRGRGSRRAGAGAGAAEAALMAPAAPPPTAAQARRRRSGKEGHSRQEPRRQTAGHLALYSGSLQCCLSQQKLSRRLSSHMRLFGPLSVEEQPSAPPGLEARGPHPPPPGSTGGRSGAAARGLAGAAASAWAPSVPAPADEARTEHLLPRGTGSDPPHVAATASERGGRKHDTGRVSGRAGLGARRHRAEGTRGRSPRLGFASPRLRRPKTAGWVRARSRTRQRAAAGAPARTCRPGPAPNCPARGGPRSCGNIADCACAAVLPAGRSQPDASGGGAGALGLRLRAPPPPARPRLTAGGRGARRTDGRPEARAGERAGVDAAPEEVRVGADRPPPGTDAGWPFGPQGADRRLRRGAPGVPP